MATKPRQPVQHLVTAAIDGLPRRSTYLDRTDLIVVVPSPTCPYSLKPQHHRLLLSRITHECQPPAATALHSSVPARNGVVTELSLVPCTSAVVRTSSLSAAPDPAQSTIVQFLSLRRRMADGATLAARESQAFRRRRVE
jgi:hypothetical protein